MVIKTLSVRQFRNIKEAFLPFSNGVNILHGPNAQGKTNLLEALWMFCAFKSFRYGKQKDLILTGSEFARLDMTYASALKEGSGTVKIFPDGKMQTEFDGLGVSAAEAVGTVQGVLFIPSHLRLITDGPEMRRRFLNYGVGQLHPALVKLMTAYALCVRNRNALLRSEAPENELDVWEEKAAQYGAQIVLARREYVSLLNRGAPAFLKELSGGKDGLKVTYGTFTDADNVGDIHNALLSKLHNNREKDREAGITSAGPHRDDLILHVNGKAAREFASQGQQRSCVMALKMAESDILYRQTGEQPVLLLDDVFSELDAMRRDYITEKIRDRQVIITSCEPLDRFTDATIFTVEKGTFSKA